MSILSLLTQTATIKRGTDTATKEYGLPVKTWATSSTVACLLDESGGKEFIWKTRSVRSDATLYLPYGTDITEQDRVVVDSINYEVGPIVDPANQHSHLEAQIWAVK